MSIKNKTQLKAEVNTAIRVGGQPAKTKATDVRNLLHNVIDSSVSTINNIPPDADGNVMLNISGVQAQSFTYTELVDLVAANSLVPGNFYIVEDFATIHQIPYTSPAVIHTGELEPLTLLAVSENAFSPVVYSATYPNDILHYDFSSKICEDGITLRKGLITYREDMSRSIALYYDWRNVKFRRWSVTAPAWTSQPEGYSLNAVVEYQDRMWVSMIAANTLEPTSVNRKEWFCLWKFTNESHFIPWQYHPQPSRYIATITTAYKIGFYSVTVDSNLYQDYYTFNAFTDATSTTAINIHDSIYIQGVKIGKGQSSGTGFNNIVFLGSANGIQYNAWVNVKLGDGSYNCTFSSLASNIDIRGRCFNVTSKAAITSFSAQWVGNSSFSDSRECNVAGFVNNFNVSNDSVKMFNNVSSSLLENLTINRDFTDVIFIGKVYGCYITGRLDKVTFAGSISNNTKINVDLSASTLILPLSAKTLTGSFANVTIDRVSPDGSLWASSVDNSGALVTQKIV